MTTRPAELAPARSGVPVVFNYLVLVAAALVVPALLLETSKQSDIKAIAIGLDWAIWLAFVAELVVLLRAADDRVGWLRKHPLDVLLVVLTPPFLPGPVQAIRAMRLLRLVRLVRVIQLASRLLTVTGLRFAAGLTGVLILVGGTAFAEVEKGQHLSAWDGVWWATTTVTTVGYGDISPHTDGGRVIAIGLMVCGVGFVAMLTAAFAQRFVRQSSPIEAVLAELRAVNERLERLEAAADRQRSSGPAG